MKKQYPSQNLRAFSLIELVVFLILMLMLVLAALKMTTTNQPSLEYLLDTSANSLDMGHADSSCFVKDDYVIAQNQTITIDTSCTNTQTSFLLQKISNENFELNNVISLNNQTLFDTIDAI